MLKVKAAEHLPKRIFSLKNGYMWWRCKFMYLLWTAWPTLWKPSQIIQKIRFLMVSFVSSMSYCRMAGPAIWFQMNGFKSRVEGVWGFFDLYPSDIESPNECEPLSSCPFFLLDFLCGCFLKLICVLHRRLLRLPVKYEGDIPGNRMLLSLFFTIPIAWDEMFWYVGRWF